MAIDARLAFLASARFEDSQVTRGGILVADADTKPLEFRCTGPIRPTPFQRLLYGSVLEVHILVELIGRSLLTSVTEKPRVILIREPILLELQPKVEPTVLLLGRHGEFDSAASGRPGAASPPDPLLTSASGRFEPIVLHCYKGYEKRASEARSDLSVVFAHSDVIEPIDRVRAALEFAHQQKLGEQK